MDQRIKGKRYYGSTCGKQQQICPKSRRSGCDAVVAEGFEAGGHNGREETTRWY